MACVDELFVGDEGTSIQFLIKECDDTDPDNPVETLVDVSTASAFNLKFLKPDKTTLIKTNPDVLFLTDGTDSLVHYVTVLDDIDQKGTWKAQLRVIMPTGKYYASIVKFKVSNQL